jgi:hypothetical protein
MVVVVADTRLVAGGAAGGLDAAQQSGVRERVEDVVDRRRGDAAEPLARGGGDRARVDVAARLLDGREHRQPRGGHVQAPLTQARARRRSRTHRDTF